MSLRSFVSRCARDPSHLQKRLRWEAWKLGPEREVEVSSLHGDLVFSSKDQVIGRALYLTDEFALSEILGACDLLAREGLLPAAGNGLLLDIGANIGTTCIPLVQRGLFRSALAFEPEVKNLDFLAKNVAKNGLSARIRIFPYALSSREGEAELALSASNFGDHRVRLRSSELPPGPGASSSVRTRSIQLKTLDGVLSAAGIDPASISLLWMDTQGHEAEVLMGARSILERRIPLVAEFWPAGVRAAGSDLSAYLALLGSTYRFFYDLQDAKRERCPVSELPALVTHLGAQDSYTDLVFIP